MKALVLWGLKEPLVYQDFTDPILAGDEVIVELKAAALNRRDFYITRGMYPGIVFPAVLGSDGAGMYKDREVVLYPAADWGGDPACQSSAFKILGMPDHGCFARQIGIRYHYLFNKPAHLTMQQAAALPLAGLTAYRALFTRARLQPGEKVLVSGIGGGVALQAFQFAHALGCEVYVTSGDAGKIEKAKEMGAMGGANYRDEDFARQLKGMAGGFDVIIDSAGGEGFAKFLDVINPGGRIVVYGGTAGKIPNLSPQRLFWKQASILGSTMGTVEEFKKMLDFISEHRIVPVVDSVYKLEDGNQAIEKLGKGGQFGKIVLEIE